MEKVGPTRPLLFPEGPGPGVYPDGSFRDWAYQFWLPP
jgi:hypothetical protein